MDGLRLDATQQIFDASPVHVLSELSQRVCEVAGQRKTVLIAENEPQDVVCLAPLEKGGYGLDAMWNDDFHHSSMVSLTGRREAYYSDYRVEPQEFISMIKRGFLYQGQRYRWQKKPRGTVVTTEPASAFVLFTQNQDQIANSLYGQRIHTLTSPTRYRAVTALMLLAPGTPMFFMGQEFGASSPFLFFADHREKELAKNVYRGRKKFLAQFPSHSSPEAQERIPDPRDISTFGRSKLNLSERESHAEIYLFHQDLLRLRREDPVIAAQDRGRIDGAVLGPGAFVLRFFGEEKGDRLLVVNLRADYEYDPAPEPLLAPVGGGSWQIVWSSGGPRYGGRGIVNPYTEEGWKLPGESALLFSSLFAKDKENEK